MEDVMQSNFTDSALDYDLIMDELLSGDICLETPDYSNFFNQPFSPLFSFSNMSEIENREFEEKETVKKELENPNWWIQPREQVVSLKDRLSHALRSIIESQKGSDVLAQIWVPIIKEGQHFLTTNEQPFWLDSNSQSLPSYRAVSMGYQFSVENRSNEIVGLPGRVYLGKVPEWTPDVRYFSSKEYPRVDHAQKYNVCGTVALPIFERDSRVCIGVVEIVLTTRKISYSFELENICNALQAVNLRSSGILTIPRAKVNKNSYQAALPEIHHVLKTVCDSHSLPLAQTWITCTEQDKHGSRHSDENYKHCVSTVDSACYIKDLSMLDFHKACSEHHLFRDQGVAGKAFTTNQPCFSNDITRFTKAEYPLSHCAKLFNLRAAVAIRLRSILTGNADFVLELFLPVNCIKSEEQKSMLDALSITIQKVCQTLRVVDDKEIENEDMLEIDESYSSNLFIDDSVSVVKLRDLQEKEARNSLPYSTKLEFGKQEIEELGLSSDWDILSKVECPEESMFSESKEQKSNLDKINEYSRGYSKFPRGRTNEKRRTKAEKNVSLEVLRQHFAGSLKDAAKNIGVCPTTLKRICRTHGITRWPSRKIKKVGNSLQKLQVVIDSVQGAEGTFQFSSVYENLTTKTSTPTEKLSVKHNSLSTSPSSSCSHSSNSCFGSNCSKQITFKQEATNLERANSVVNLHVSSQEPIKPITRSQSHSCIEILSQLEKKRLSVFKVKAFCGEEKARLRLESTWGYRELKETIMRRFNISDNYCVDLKYLDDDHEWVLLTCDEDLQECMDVYKSSNVSTIKMSVHPSVKS